MRKWLTYLTHDDYLFLALAKTDLAEIALAQKDRARALYWLRQSRTHPRLHIRRTLVFLSAVAGYVLSSANPTAASYELAAQIFGSVEALGERSGIILSPFWRQLNQDRMAITRQHLSKGSWQNVFDHGRGWSKEHALAKADEVLEYK